MKINQVIKEKRMAIGLTQEQVAECLGVSTPAVNKWEKGHSYPDITLLPPLARLLNVDLNTLLCFNKNLTNQEIALFTNELVVLMNTSGFDSGFNKAMDKIREYPNCHQLIQSVATVLKGSLYMFGVSNKACYEERINQLFEKLTTCEEGEIRNQAISMLINIHIEKKDYPKAQTYIDQLPNITYDKLQSQGMLYMHSGELEKAAELFENKLLTSVMELFTILASMMDIALKENRNEDAMYFAQVIEKANDLFDLWDYNTYASYFQLYTAQKDAKNCLAILEKMLPALNKKWDVSNSALYKHIKAKESEANEHDLFLTAFVDLLKNDPNNDLDFIKNTPEFENLLRRHM